jgi:hypothetical protein
MGRILRKLRLMSVRSLYREDHAVELGSQVENTDALAATGGRGVDPQGGTAHPGFPPGYVKTDEERPRH